MIHNANSDDELQMLFEDVSVSDVLLQTRFRKPISSLHVFNKQEVIDVIINYHLMMKVKCEMDQFLDGLQTYGLLDKFRKNPSLWKTLFIHSPSKLETDDLNNILGIL
jgi:quinol-cytochrome oxidoreductase complex cytochrome b subunit